MLPIYTIYRKNHNLTQFNDNTNTKIQNLTHMKLQKISKFNLG